MIRPSDERFSHLSGKKVLVTGGTGFVGRHLLPRLLAAGAHVTCLTRAASRTGITPPANSIRGYSTVGSAIRSQRIGQGFESPYLHQVKIIRTFW